MSEETCCHHIGYSFWLTARVRLYAPSHIQDSTYQGLWYTSRGALAGTRNSSMGPTHEGSTRRPIAPWANALTTELHLTPKMCWMHHYKIIRSQFEIHPCHWAICVFSHKNISDTAVNIVFNVTLWVATQISEILNLVVTAATQFVLAPQFW